MYPIVSPPIFHYTSQKDQIQECPVVFRAVIVDDARFGRLDETRPEIHFLGAALVRPHSL
jgi:hypothetical protein